MWTCTISLAKCVLLSHKWWLLRFRGGASFRFLTNNHTIFNNCHCMNSFEITTSYNSYPILWDQFGFFHLQITKLILSGPQLCGFLAFPTKAGDNNKRWTALTWTCLGLRGPVIYNQPQSAATCSDAEPDNYCFLLTGDVASCDWLITQSIV